MKICLIAAASAMLLAGWSTKDNAAGTTVVETTSEESTTQEVTIEETTTKKIKKKSGKKVKATKKIETTKASVNHNYNYSTSKKIESVPSSTKNVHAALTYMIFLFHLLCQNE